MAKGEKCSFYKHGLSREPLYAVYIQMIARCHNPNHSYYKHYGAVGRTVCEEWRNDRLKFFEWAYANGYKKGLTLDRIDNSKGYSPENCRWADRYVQQNNMRRNHRITINGESHTISEWARIKGINKGTICSRLADGWSEEDAVLIPKSNESYKNRCESKLSDGKDYRQKTIKAIKESGITQGKIAEQIGISKASMSRRLSMPVSSIFYNQVILAIENFSK